MLYANKQALELIHQLTNCNKTHTSGKDLTIPVGNHVLLCDHTESQNKIQDQYKSDMYVMIGQHEEPNVYYSQLLNGHKPGQHKVVNQHQLFDLNQSSPPSTSTSLNDGFATIPSFLTPKQSNSNLSNSTTQDSLHDYNTHSKWKTPAASRQMVAETIVKHL